jgi:hypothetical protein
MPTSKIKQVPFLIPRSTSQLRVRPAYEKPLMQLKYDAKEPDKSKHIRVLPEFPKDLPPAAAIADLDMEAEAQYLAAEYTLQIFRTVYPTDEAFAAAFRSCEIAVLPGEENAVPDMSRNTDSLVEEFVELKVPTLKIDRARMLVDAGYTVANITKTDVKTVSARSGLSVNLIRSTIEASRKYLTELVGTPVPRGVPSAPNEMKATIEAPVPV